MMLLKAFVFCLVVVPALVVVGALMAISAVGKAEDSEWQEELVEHD